MNDFLSALPWRLGSLSALIVAGLSAANGVDAWVTIERCGIAFVAFWCMGSLAKALLSAADPNRAEKFNGTFNGSHMGGHGRENLGE